MKQKLKFKFCGMNAELQLTDELECGETLVDSSKSPPITIRIGKNAPKTLFLQTLFHELLECALILNGTQYACTDQNNYKVLFQFEHDKFTIITDEVSLAYEELKEKLGL